MLLRKLICKTRSYAVPPSTIPIGQRVYAIGDVHGRLDLLNDLLDRIAADDARRCRAQTTLVFLGDLVDRGPDSAGVIQRAIRLRESDKKVRFIKGNHEEVFLKACAGDIKATRFMIRIGGRSTILSYGISEDEYGASTFDRLTELLAERVPQEHLAFLHLFEEMIVIGDYAFVHAGIRPGIELAAQSPADLRWIRSEFLDHRARHEKIIVHGHSIVEKPEICANRIGIDTGAFASGRLTALGLEMGDRWLLSTGPSQRALENIVMQ